MKKSELKILIARKKRKTKEYDKTYMEFMDLETKLDKIGLELNKLQKDLGEYYYDI